MIPLRTTTTRRATLPSAPFHEAGSPAGGQEPCPSVRGQDDGRQVISRAESLPLVETARGTVLCAGPVSADFAPCGSSCSPQPPSSSPPVGAALSASPATEPGATKSQPLSVDPRPDTVTGQWTLRAPDVTVGHRPSHHLPRKTKGPLNRPTDARGLVMRPPYRSTTPTRRGMTVNRRFHLPRQCEEQVSNARYMPGTGRAPLMTDRRLRLPVWRPRRKRPV